MNSATMSPVAPAAEGLLARRSHDITRRSPAKLRCVHRWIEMQAARVPEAIAVVSGAESLTYAQLNARANRLARRLRNLGVGPEVLVGLCTGRTAAMVVGLLAILKAGGTYVPLDPTYPAQRLRFMLDDAHLSVLLTEEWLRDQLPSGAARVLCLDSESEAGAAASAANLEGGAAAANLAYVIYTSGSTGRPKGVQVTHAALANLLQAMRGLLAIHERDRLLAVTTLSFDIAALEIFLPLIVGGRVELIERDVAADGARLADRLNDPAITFLQATPATWRLLLEAGWRGQPTLKLLCGGEALPRALADRLVDKGAALWNLYGPTETTVWSSAWRVEPGETPISVGRPIANTRLYVLDKRLRAVPVGVIGELYIGGVGAGAWLSGSPRPDGRAVHPRPVRNSAWRSTIPVRRPGSLAARWDTRMPGAGGSPGKDSRVSRRAGGDRGGSGAAPWGARGGRGGSSGWKRGDELGGIYRGRATGPIAAPRPSCAGGSWALCRSTWSPRRS